MVSDDYSFRRLWLSGLGLIVASNVQLCVVLIVLRSASSSSAQRTFVLAAANALAVFSIFRSKGRNPSEKEGDPFIYLQLVGWSLAYCLTYGLFAIFPHKISLSQLIICQSLAPIFATWISGDLAIERSSWWGIITRLSPVFVLLILAQQRWSGEGLSGQPGLASLLIGGLFLGLVISQTLARRLARKRPALWLQPRFTFFNAIGLGLALVLSGQGRTIDFTSDWLYFAAGAAFLIVGIQGTYLSGLRKTEPVLSALGLSTSVPISLFVDSVWYGKPLPFIQMILGFSFCCSVFINHWTRNYPLQSEV